MEEKVMIILLCCHLLIQCFALFLILRAGRAQVVIRCEHKEIESTRPCDAAPKAENETKEQKAKGRAYRLSEDVDARMSGKIVDMFD